MGEPNVRGEADTDKLVSQVSDQLQLSFQSVNKKTDIQFHGGAYLLKSGSLTWWLRGANEEVTVDVQGPALVGHLELLHGRDHALVPPYAKDFATIVPPAEVAEITAKHRKLGAIRDTTTYPDLADALRFLFCRAGWDPYLEGFRRFAGIEGLFIFHNIAHPYEDGPELPMLNLRAWSARREWVDTAVKQGEVPRGLLLVWNGFVRPRLRLQGEGGEDWVVTGEEAPVLVAEFERPLGGSAQLPRALAHSFIGATPAGASIEVQANRRDDYHEEWVYGIEMPYAEYVRCVEKDPAVEVATTALVRQRTLDWLPRLAIGTNHELLVAILVRDRWRRAQERGQMSAMIPWEVWDSFLHERGRDSGIEKLEKLRDDGVLDFREEQDEGNTSTIKILRVNQELLAKVIGGTGRKSRAGDDRGLKDGGSRGMKKTR